MYSDLDDAEEKKSENEKEIGTLYLRHITSFKKTA
jgi:hypothetical protein